MPARGGRQRKKCRSSHAVPGPAGGCSARLRGQKRGAAAPLHRQKYSSIYTGQNMGKHDIDRVCQGLRDSLKALCVICLVLAVAVFASRRLLLSIFLDPATDAASIAQGADFLSVMGFAYIIAAVMNSYLNVLRGAGDVNVSLVAGLFEMGARLAFASLLAPHLGVWGIWLATPLSWASGCIIPVVRYYSKEWMKRTLI
ncbi:MAG: MATE family efflux transporter [Subdoligranulum sp.]